MHASREQLGMSLISLMVGAAISLLLAAGMLQLFKTVLRISAEAQLSATHDSELSAALLSSSFVIQGAGFGIQAPEVPRDFVWINNAVRSGQAQLQGSISTPPRISASTTTTSELPSFEMGSAVIWRSNTVPDSGSSQCEALYAPQFSASEGLSVNAGLYHFISLLPCPENLQQVTWQNPRPLAEGLHIALHAQWQTCTPMGHTLGGGTTDEHLSVQITATNSAGITLAEVFCLSNYSQPQS